MKGAVRCTLGGWDSLISDSVDLTILPFLSHDGINFSYLTTQESTLGVSNDMQASNLVTEI